MNEIDALAPSSQQAACRRAASRCCGADGECENALSVFQHCLDFLEALLADAADEVSVGEIESTLAELSCVIDAGPELELEQFANLFQRLIGIYGEGVGQKRHTALTQTATGYADLVNAASARYPEVDYSGAVGQLLCYMGQHFRTRLDSWKHIYEDVIELLRGVGQGARLDRSFFAEIQKWTDEGAANLFNIRRDTELKIARLELTVNSLLRVIEDINASLPEDLVRQPVVRMADLSRRRELERLHRTCTDTVQDIEETRAILLLIDENIAEFEDKLHDLRRSYNVRAVGSLA